MPYITKDKRKLYNPLLDNLFKELKANGLKPGDFNYCFSYLFNKSLDESFSYTKINELIGILECTKLELYRKPAADLEQIKESENGEVYQKFKK